MVPYAPAVTVEPPPTHVRERPGSSRALLVATLLFVLTVQWSGLLVGAFQLSDIILAGLLVVALLGPRTTGPRARGITIVLVTVAVATAIGLVFPADPTWLTQRFTGFGSTATAAGLGQAGLGSWAFLVKLSLATAGAWVVLPRLAHDRGVRWFTAAWLAGAVASALVALAQWKAGLDLSGFLAQPEDSPRAAGLSFYPNSLGLYSAASIPLAAPLLRRPVTIALGVGCVVALWCGILAADSRIGIGIAVVCTLALPFLTGRRGRPTVTAIVVLAVASPWILQGFAWVRSNTRLRPDGGIDSDLGRSLVNQQSLHDFEHSPIFGLGFGVGGGGISAPLCLLSGGGLLVLGGYLAFLGWCYVRAYPARSDSRVKVLLFAGTAVVVMICFQNNLTDRGQYLFLLLAVLIASGKRPSELPHQARMRTP